jgi:hypothetical protein
MKYIYSILLLFSLSSVYCQDADERLMPWYVNHKFMFCDSSGAQKIALQFDYAEPFSSNFAIVGNATKLGVINHTGKIIVPVKFRHIEYRSFYNPNNTGDPFEIYFSVNDDSLFYSRLGKIMKEGPEELLLTSIDEFMGNYSQIFTRNGKFGYVEGSDTTVPAMYKSLSQPCDGYTIFIAQNDDSDFGMVTSDNEPLLPFEYSKINWDTDYRIFILEKENIPGPCYYAFQGTNVKNPVLCGYKRLIKRFSNYILVENQDNLMFYVEVKNGRELRK